MAPVVILGHSPLLTSTQQDYDIPDPELSDLGEQQCHRLQDALRNELPIAQSVELIVASPMKRTLQTAQLALKWLIDRGVLVEARAEWQDPIFPSKAGRYAFTPKAITSGGEDCRSWLRARPEKVIAVVSHSGFLRVGVCNCGFANADYRVFDFVDDRLVEWEVTKNKGGGMGMSKKGWFGIESQPWPEESTQDAEQIEQVKAPGEVTAEIPIK